LLAVIIRVRQIAVSYSSFSPPPFLFIFLPSISFHFLSLASHFFVLVFRFPFSGVWGEAPAEIEFCAFQLLKITSSGNYFYHFSDTY